MKHEDTVTGVVLLVFCGLAYLLTMGFAEVPAMLSQNVPPTFFPRLVLAVMAGLGLVLIARGARTEPVAGPGRRTWLAIAVIAGAGVASEWLGILVTLGLAGAVLQLLWGERRPVRLTPLALCLPAALYLIFTIGLGVRFPAGRLFEVML